MTAYGRTAQEAVRRLQQKLDTNLGTLSSRTTLSSYLSAWLLWRKDQGSLRPYTWRNYVQLARLYIVPYLGTVPLGRLTTQDVDALHTTLHQKGISASTIRRVKSILNQAMRQAVVWGLLTTNPVAESTAPTVRYKEPDIWTPEETRQFFNALRGDWLYPLFYTAVTSGLRMEELRALQWQDIDLDAGTVTVRRALSFGRDIKPLKTEASARTITLPPDTVSLLRQLRPRDARPEDWVFVNREGKPWIRVGLWNAFRTRCIRAGVRPIPLKNLRHLHASLLLRAGVDLASVAKRLGHTNINTAPRYYIRIAQEAERRGAVPLDRLLDGQK